MAGSPSADRFESLILEITRAVDGLDLRFNANRVARYEWGNARAALEVFLRGSDTHALEEARARAGRLIEMLPERMRQRVRAPVAEMAALAAALGPSERARALAALAEDGPREEVARPSMRVSDPLAGLPGLAAQEPFDSKEIVGDEVDLIIELLHHLPRGLEHWTWERQSSTRAKAGRFWHIDNERHVQNLLWLSLAPSLPGLAWEETLPSLGVLQPRVDLALPELNLVIEVKVIRGPSDFALITEAIAADSALYTAGRSPYERLLVFVWDQSRTTERHETLVRGLRSLRGVVDAVVVARPGNMEAKADTA